MRFSLLGGGGGGLGIQRVADAAARTALTPTDGLTVLQLDTDEIWVYDVTGAAWLRVAGPLLAFSFTDSSSIDFTYTSATQDLTAALKLSSAAAGAGNLKIANSLETDGLLSQIQPANGSQGGYLTSTDWGLFDQARQDINAHLIDTTAHDASDIVFDPGYVGSTLSATDLQAAIEELDTEVDGRLDLLEADQHVAVTLAAVGSSPNANGATITGQVLNLEPANGSHPGVVSTAAQTFAGEKTFTDSMNIVGWDVTDLTGAGPGAGQFTAIGGGMPATVGMFFQRTGDPYNYIGLSNDTTHLVHTQHGTRLYTGTPTYPQVSDGDLSSPYLLLDLQADAKGIRLPIQDSTTLGSMSDPATHTIITRDDVDGGSVQMYDGSSWKRIDGSFEKITQSSSDGAALPSNNYSNRTIYFVSGSGGPITYIDPTSSPRDGAEFVYIGTSDTNTVMINPSPLLKINGTCTLGEGDSLTLVYSNAGSCFYEIGRNA